MHVLRPALALLVTLFVPGIVSAAERSLVPGVDEYFTLSYATGVEPSPDGRYAVYTEMRWEKDQDARNTDLWVADLTSKSITRLTFDSASDDSPRWSPDSRWVYFLTSRRRDDGAAPYNGKKQVWRVAREGGEIFAVTRLAESVSQFQLSEDGKTLYYTVGAEHVDDDVWEDLRDDFKKLHYGHGVTTFSEVWKMDLEPWRAERLVDDRRVIVEMAVSPDAKRIAMITRPDENLITNEGWSRVDVYEVGTKTLTPLVDTQWREEAPSPYGWLLDLGWSSDSQVLSFRVDFDGYPGEVFFAHFDHGADPLIRKLTRPGETTAEGPMLWMPGGRTFTFASVDHGRRRVKEVREIRGTTQGADRDLTPGDIEVDDFGFSRRGDLITLAAGLDHGLDVFVVRNPGPRATFERITNLNPQVDTWQIGRLEIVRWTAPDGTPVEGILELPAGWKPQDGPLPLLLSIHGGPTSCSYYAFTYSIYGRGPFAPHGWAVFDPNYRGSTGYGDKFLTDLIGRENDIEVTDILTGVDELIRRGVADSTRMAVMGWSNGGFLTNCIITKDPRFKAASSGAGVFDQAMQWSIEDTPGHVINYMRGLPWQNPEAMKKASPLYAADKIKAATLIHVGENDERVPAEHSRSMYRALRHYLQVPTELVVYPGEGHGLTKYSHREAKMKWDERWMNHYVLDKKDPEL